MHVVFDLDGVLLDSETDLAWLDRALEATLEHFDIEPTEENRRRLYPGTITSVEAVADQFGIPVQELWETRNENYIQEKIQAIQTGEIGPYPDINVVESIAETAPVSIISNSPDAVVEAFVETNGLEEAIAFTIGRGTSLSALDRLKPDPHPYERLEEQAGAESYVYIGDSPDDELFAERTGMTYIHLDRQTGPVDSLEAVRRKLREMDLSGG